MKDIKDIGWGTNKVRVVTLERYISNKTENDP
jgi:hypothetical protein